MISSRPPSSASVSTCDDPLLYIKSDPPEVCTHNIPLEKITSLQYVVRAIKYQLIIAFTDAYRKILTALGLAAAPGQAPPNHASALLLANWALAYVLTSTRAQKFFYGLDHNVMPRDDLSKYGEAAVQAGKLDRRTLNKLKRQEAAHANAQEGYPFFVAASKSLFLGINDFFH
jgi:hypothetical protein